MKKSFLIAAMAGLAFVGCTNDEVSNSFNQEREITFANPYVSKTTKAVYQEMENPYSTAEKFNVFGVWHKEAFEGWATNASLYMDNATTQYDDTYNGWRPETRYYWPKNGYLTFAAYSPTDAKSASSGITYDATGLHITGFQVANNNANHIDLMYSERSYNKKKVDGTANTNTPYDEVDLDFKHALSSIHFTAKLAQDYTGTTITLNKISIYGVHTKGNFNENVTDGTTYTAAPAWTGQSSPLAEANAYVYYNSNQVLTTGVFAMKDATSQVDVIALPQELPDSATIKIEYTIDAPGATTPAIAQVNTVKIADLTTKTWEPGKRYIYNMTFSFEEIYFAPEILDWVNAGDTEVEIDDYQ